MNCFTRKTSSGTRQVYLSKRIPPEAGLGGGSANAATALFAANELAGRPAILKDLQLWSGELGSDITFFLSSGTCYCTGRGEILHPQQPLAPARSVRKLRFGQRAHQWDGKNNRERAVVRYHDAGSSTLLHIPCHDRPAEFRRNRILWLKHLDCFHCRNLFTEPRPIRNPMSCCD